MKIREAKAQPHNSRDLIVDAAIRMIAKQGLGNVSYRGIALEAGVSLALVNYHFPAKAELIACTSHTIMTQLKRSFEHAAMRMQAQSSRSLGDFAVRFLTNAIGRDRLLTIAWAEIVMDAPRHAESLALSLQWHAMEREIWTGVVAAAGSAHPETDADLLIDLLTGLLFLTLGTGIDDTQAGRLVAHGYRATSHGHATLPPPAADARSSRKAAATRMVILRAAVDIFTRHGAAGISFRAVAQCTGLSLSAPAYYFKSIENLLEQSLLVIITETKDRYRSVYREGDFQGANFDAIVDLTNAIFIREATSFSGENMAFFSSWIQATRVPQLQRAVASFILDQERAWTRALTDPPAGSAFGCLAVALFAGKLIRITTTGSRTFELAAARREFATQLASLASDGFATPRPIN